MNPNCLGCKSEIRTFFHTIWECPVVDRVWSNVHHNLTQVVVKPVIKDPKHALLELMEEWGGPRGTHLLVAVDMMIANRDILRGTGAQTVHPLE